MELGELIALHRDPIKWTLLYRVLYRITHGEHHLLKIDIDDDVRELRNYGEGLRRDMHKMTAFVRFRKVEGSASRSFCGLAPARSSDCGADGAVVPQPLRQHAVVDLDSGCKRALGFRSAAIWTRSAAL